MGLRHEEPLLSKVHAFLAEQAVLIDSGFRECPKCGAKLSKYGFVPSKFHAVFSDHKLRLQKHCCKNPDCNWQSTPTTSTVFGTDTHPDLVKLQCEQGALHSYREAQDNLEKLNCQRRSVNNHVQIQHITNQVESGYLIRIRNLRTQRSYPSLPRSWLCKLMGHIPTKDRGKRVLKLCLV